jgi:Na+-transporting NADH:ubiquinone oxidoreductase subunit NqrB
MGMALGVAGIGAIFFALLGPAHTPRAFVYPAEWTLLVTVVLLGLAFVTAFWLPRRARQAGPVAAPAAATDVTAPALADAA